jgi:adenylate cyclase class 2
MLEVEMKFSVPDLAALQSRLADWGAVASPPRQDADQYFNAPDRDFARTDEALRLRRIGSLNFVTYKGPKRNLQTKTRTEIEVPLADGDAAAEEFARILVHLRYRPVAIVRKRRRTYHLHRDGFLLEICLDEVEELGSFAEIETVVSEDQLEPAQAAVMRTAVALGLTASERRSYLQLLLEKRSSQETSP